MNLYKKIIKRLLDLLFSTTALIVFSPLCIITAVAIKLSSPGPVFYYSFRAGLNSKPFRFFKFRSMHITNNDKHLCITDTERVFQVGKIIRRLKIDELPQLINVIKGDMSIVGPRPLMVESVEKYYCGKYKKILSVKPGLTSAASLYDYIVGDLYTDDEKYRKEIIPIKLEMELMYIEKMSFLYDAQLVLRTIKLIICVAVGKKNMKDQPELIELKKKYNN